MTDFTPTEQGYVDDLVNRRATSFKRPHWMQRHRERAIVEEARRRIEAAPARPGHVRSNDRVHYHAPARVRAIGGRGAAYKVHEAGSDGRPICTMGQNPEWRGEHLDAGPVTCAKCAGARSR